ARRDRRGRLRVRRRRCRRTRRHGGRASGRRVPAVAFRRFGHEWDEQAPLAPGRRGAASPAGSPHGQAVRFALGRGHGCRRLVRRGRRRGQGGVPALRRRAGLARRSRPRRSLSRGRRGRRQSRLGRSAGGGGVNYTWYVERAGGMLAFVLLTGSVVLGLLLSNKASLKRWPRFAL